jgi:hypothetical protein
MAFKIITADERLASKSGIKGVIFGGSKIGKTSLLWTMDPESTLFLDLEAGGLSVQGWKGDSNEIRTWEYARDIAAFIGGPNPALRDEQPYSQAHYDHVLSDFGDPTAIDKYKTIFIDSITVAGRLCFQWAKGQPQSFSEKTGKPNMLGTYGLHGQEMIGWLTQLQHTKGKNIWFVGLLDKKVDDFNRVQWVPQIEGAKTGLELPGIVDEVISMVEMAKDDGETYRAFVCQTPNTWGYPAGDRSGTLNAIEKPHLGELMEKISNGKRNNPASYTYNIKEEANE